MSSTRRATNVPAKSSSKRATGSPKEVAETICIAGVKSIECMDSPKIPLIFNTLFEDNTASHEEALLRIYQRLRPGNPPQLEKARTLFNEKFLRR